MAVSPTPPSISILPPAPLPTDAEAVFDAKAGVRLTAEEVMITEQNAALAWQAGSMAETKGYKEAAATSAGNAASSANAAANSATSATTNGAAQVQLAAEQVGLAVTARQGAEAAFASAQVTAAAAQAAAGLPSLVDHDAFDVLQVNAAKNGVQWGKVGQVVGDILQSVVSPGALYLPADGSIYLKSAYPLLAAAIGTINEKNFAGSFVDVPVSLFGTATIKAVATGLNGVMVAVCDCTSGTPTFGAARSIDGGATWTGIPTTQLSSGTSVTYYSVATDKKGVWIICAGANSLYRSTDNGVTWAGLASGTVATPIVISTDENGVWLLGGSSGARSVNNGTAWAAVSTPSMVSGGGFVTDKLGNWVAAGNAGTLSRSSDGGVTWAVKASGLTTQIWGGATDGKGRWIFASTYSLITSLDNGMTWKTTAAIAGSNQGGATSSTPVVVDVNGIWATVSTQGTISRSLDGETWSQSVSSFGTGAINAITADTGGNFVAVGVNGKIGRAAPAYFYDSSTQFKVPKVAANGPIIPYIKSKVA